MRYDKHNFSKNGSKIFFAKGLDTNLQKSLVGQITCTQTIVPSASPQQDCRIIEPNKRLTKKMARRFVMRDGVIIDTTHRYLWKGRSKLYWGGAITQNMPETTMRKTILTIFASALLAGSMIQAATAGEHHRVSRAARAAPVVVNPNADFRNSYGWSNPDNGYWASRVEGGAVSAPAGR